MLEILKLAEILNSRNSTVEMLEMHKKQVILKIVKILNSIGSREARDDKKQAILKIAEILNSRESIDARDAQEASYSENCRDSQF
jgi:hypothetical protein